MTSQTHKRFAIFWVYIGAMVIYKMNISNVNYYIMLIIMLSTGKVGALFPDVDHHWKNVKEKTTINWFINKFIHLTGGKHRSWQTHSWDICIIFTLTCYTSSIYLFKAGKVSDIDFELFNIVTAGFNLGWASHLFSDMLTSTGVRLLCFIKKPVVLVPKYLSRGKCVTISAILICVGILTLKLRVGIIIIMLGLALLITTIKIGDIKFNTGNEWEAYVYSVTKKLNILVGFVAAAYPWLKTIEINKNNVSILDTLIKLISR